MDGVLGGPRRRNQDSETESQRLKREKAAERQRRKRKRDRRNAATVVPQDVVSALQQQQPVQAAAAGSQLPQVQPVAQTQQPPGQRPPLQSQHIAELTSDEIVRREKVRAAARDRQRKHRALVKRRRLIELGLDVDDFLDDNQYGTPSEPQYQSVLPPELQQLGAPPPHEPPFPHGAPLGGETFASTLLLAFSCAPLLKQHLLRSLAMTNEELVSLEPVIAEAWDRWDHQRRLHYAEVAKNGGQPPPYAVDLGQHDPHAPHPSEPYPNGAAGPSDPSQHVVQLAQVAAANDFRARFHRSIVATPFQTASSTPVSSGSAAAPTEAMIDPHLATSGESNAASGSQTAVATANGTNKT